MLEGRMVGLNAPVVVVLLCCARALACHHEEEQSVRGDEAGCQAEQAPTNLPLDEVLARPAEDEQAEAAAESSSSGWQRADDKAEAGVDPQ